MKTVRYNNFKYAVYDREDTKNLSERIGQNCYAFREQSGISRLEMATQFNISYSNIVNFENGKNNSAVILRAYVLLGYDCARKY